MSDLVSMHCSYFVHMQPITIHYVGIFKDVIRKNIAKSNYGIIIWLSDMYKIFTYTALIIFTYIIELILIKVIK